MHRISLGVALLYPAAGCSQPSNDPGMEAAPAKNPETDAIMEKIEQERKLERRPEAAE